MKNPKILPFGSWFKVYESAGRSFNKSQMILESKLQRIYEAKENLPQFKVSNVIEPVKKGNKVRNLGDLTSRWNLLGDKDTDGMLGDLMQKVVGAQEVPRMDIMTTGNWSGTVTRWDDLPEVFTLILAGVGNYHGIKNFGSQLVSSGDNENFTDRIEELGLKMDQTSEAQLTGFTSSSAQTVQSVKPGGGDLRLDSKRESGRSLLPRMLAYINGFNLINFATQSGLQYTDLDAGMNDQNVFDFLGGAAKEGVYNKYVFYTSNYYDKSSADVNQTIMKVDGVDAWSDKAEINYATGAYAEDNQKRLVDTGHPELTRIAAAIYKAAGNQEQITGMTITAGASQTWNTKHPVTSGEGQPHQFTDQNYTSQDNQKANEYLAWRRGKQVADVLYKLLGNKVKPGAIKIIWKVDDSQTNSGKTILFKVDSAGKPAKEIMKTEFTQSIAKKAGAGELKVYKREITWDTAVMQDDKKSWVNKMTKGLLGKETKMWDDLEVGDEFTFKRKIRKSGKEIITNKKRTEKITRIDSNSGLIYYRAENGKEYGISKDRFVKGPASKAEDIEG